MGFFESGCGSGRSSGPLAREIPDIFRHGWRRAGKFRNDGGWGAAARVFLFWVVVFTRPQRPFAPLICRASRRAIRGIPFSSEACFFA